MESFFFRGKAFSVFGKKGYRKIENREIGNNPLEH